MSAKSSDKPRKTLKHRVKHAATKVAGQKPEGGWNWAMLAILPIWVFAAFIFSSFAVAAILGFLSWVNLPLDNYFRPAVLRTGIALLIYAFTLAIVIGGPYVWRRQSTSLQTLGLTRMVSWTDIGLAPVVYIAYMLVLVTVFATISSWIPSLPLDQVQDVGFDAFGSRTDNLLAFLTLVVLSPIAEETLFRGYLYGKLKTYVPVVVAAIVTSLLFALVHFQLNVGIDVFILSLFLCGLRSLTGSIWAGVLVHMIKNGVAYYILFVSPLIGG